MIKIVPRAPIFVVETTKTVKWVFHLTAFVVSTTKTDARGTIVIIKWNRHFSSSLVCNTKTGTKGSVRLSGQDIPI